MKTKHYSKEKLDLYRHGELSILGRMQCAAHLKECELCRKRLDELREDDLLVGELRESLRLHRELSAIPTEQPPSAAAPSHRC